MFPSGENSKKKLKDFAEVLVKFNAEIIHFKLNFSIETQIETGLWKNIKIWYEFAQKKRQITLNEQNKVDISFVRFTFVQWDVVKKFAHASIGFNLEATLDVIVYHVIFPFYIDHK